jgi:hypothetical protein
LVPEPRIEPLIWVQLFARFSVSFAVAQTVPLSQLVQTLPPAS